MDESASVPMSYSAGEIAPFNGKPSKQCARWAILVPSGRLVNNHDRVVVRLNTESVKGKG